MRLKICDMSVGRGPEIAVLLIVMACIARSNSSASLVTDATFMFDKRRKHPQPTPRAFRT